MDHSKHNHLNESTKVSVLLLELDPNSLSLLVQFFSENFIIDNESKCSLYNTRKNYRLVRISA